MTIEGALEAASSLLGEGCYVGHHKFIGHFEEDYFVVGRFGHDGHISHWGRGETWESAFANVKEECE